jgi:iron complex outermembrane receptor protein
MTTRAQSCHLAWQAICICCLMLPAVQLARGQTQNEDAGIDGPAQEQQREEDSRVDGGPQPVAAGSPAQRQVVADEVVVYGAAYRTTGTKSDLKPLESPMSFEIYDNELLTSRQVDSVNEALRYVPGITPESRGTVTIFDQYTIRGFESYRNYYDGLPLQYNGLWNLVPQVDVFATQSIEVLKGPTSVLYGAAPPGGMVNQTSKQPQSQRSTELRGRLGTNQLIEGALDSTGNLGESVDYRLIALARRRDGQQVTTEEERALIAPSLTWRIGDRTRLNLNAYYQHDPEMIPSTPLPAVGALYPAPYGKLDSDAYAGDENWAAYDREILMAGWKLDHRFNESTSFLQNFRYTTGNALQHNTYNFGLLGDQRTLVRSAYFTDEEQDGVVVDNQLAVKFALGATAHRLLLGLEYQRLDSDIRYGDTFGNATPTIDLGNPDYDQIDPALLPLDTYTERHDIEQSQLGLYLQDEVKWGALTLVGGLRRDRYRSTDDAMTTFSAGKTEISQSETTFRAAAIYTFGNGFAPYLNYSESFEPTAGIDSMTGKPFEPTTAKQNEIGFKFRSRSGATELTAAYFDIRKQNVVVNTPTFTERTQAGEVRSKGAELAWRQLLGSKIDFTLALTDFDIDITKNPLDPALVGKTPVWVAEQQASLWVSYYATPRFELSGGVRYVGESQLDALNTDTVPSYTVFDAAAVVRLTASSRLALTASNLFDKRFVGACFDVNNCWMGPERSVELSLSVNF